jgi:spermidine/putrescine transport system permease protein
MSKKIFKNLFLYLVFAFLFLPIIVLVVYSFNSSSMNIIFGNFTFDWYHRLFQNSDLIESFINTLIVAGISTVTSTIIGTISAYGLYKYNFKGKNIINGLIYVPIVIPEIVLGISLLSIYTLMKLELSLFTIILSHIAFSIPFVIVSVRSTLTKDIKVLEESAKDLGASNYTIFKEIVLPTIMPAVISGATLAFTLSLDDVVISYFTAGPGSNTLPLYIYSMIKTGITPDVNALSTLMMLVVFTILISITIYQSHKIRKSAI